MNPIRPGDAVDVDALKDRIRERLDAHGHLDEPSYAGAGESQSATLAGVDLQPYIAKGAVLNRPREELPPSLQRLALFRIGFLRRGFMRYFSRMFEDQRRVNAAVLDVQKMENEVCLKLARRVVSLEAELAALKRQLEDRGESRDTGKQ